ncbi:sodium-dependent glucose transporter 1 isoform X1 [Lepeophtheirus salmonis]|nr:sodium-dependent glucose transporter 1-like isoform X2 [Lepeophtheirus salmonis]XP_040567094.1 sodium-dependent glucose transporter 1-like isoform X2 [Lepeophtheirus salmonis]
MVLSNKERILTTIVINLSIFSMGLCEAVKGPTLIDLTEILSTSITKVSFFFFTFSIGSLLGVLIAGYTLDRFSEFRYIILGISGVIFGFTTICIPFTHHIFILYGNSLVSGIFSGILDAGCNVENLSVWRGHKYKGSWILCFSFSYALGSFVAPLVARPFIGEVGESSQIWILYPLIGSIEILVTSSFFILYLLDKRIKAPSETGGVYENKEETKDLPKDCETINELSGIYYYCFMASTWIFFFLQMGIVTGYGSFIATYAVRGPLSFSKRRAADLTASFWAMFTLVRFFAIFGARFIPPLAFILISLSACVAGSGLAFMYQQCSICLNLSSYFFGFGASTLYATTLLWIEKEGIKITYKRGSFIFSGSAFGADAYPILIGQFIERFPQVLLELAFTNSIIMFVFFILMMGLIQKTTKNFKS